MIIFFDCFCHRVTFTKYFLEHLKMRMSRNESRDIMQRTGGKAKFTYAIQKQLKIQPNMNHNKKYLKFHLRHMIDAWAITFNGSGPYRRQENASSSKWRSSPFFPLLHYFCSHKYQNKGKYRRPYSKSCKNGKKLPGAEFSL